MKKIKKTIDEILKSRYSIYRCLLRKTTSKIIFKLLLTSIDVDDMIQKLSQDESYEYIPAVGANGGSAVSGSGEWTYADGKSGDNGKNRQTGRRRFRTD